jgi:hypothetical protein
MGKELLENGSVIIDDKQNMSGPMGPISWIEKLRIIVSTIWWGCLQSSLLRITCKYSKLHISFEVLNPNKRQKSMQSLPITFICNVVQTVEDWKTKNLPNFTLSFYRWANWFKALSNFRSAHSIINQIHLIILKITQWVNVAVLFHIFINFY